MDNRGNISIELGIVLIIVLLICGVALSLSEIGTQKIVRQEETEHVETLISEVADNLINNPGDPENWEEYGKGTPGLAIINEEGEIIPNSISYEKLIVLGSDYKKFVNKGLFDSKIKSSMELIPQKSSISSVKIGNEEDSNNVYSVNRLVKCDFYKKDVIKDFQGEGKCNHNHKQDSHSCNYFKIFKSNVEKADYYLLVDESEKYDVKYIVDTTRVVKPREWKTLISSKIDLTEEFDFYEDSSAVVFVHFDKPKPKAVLVSVPKNFDEDYLKYDYFRTNDCQFILKAWY